MFQAKLRKIGNSLGVLIPKDILENETGDIINLEIIKETPIKKTEPIPTYCLKKHAGRMIYAKTCGCY